MFRTLLRRTLYKKKGNLISLDDPFDAMRELLAQQTVQHFVDAGASDGRVAEKLMRRFPNARAHAFEPNPGYRAALEAFAAREPRFHPVFSALADAAGEVDLNFAASPGNTSLFKPARHLQDYSPAGARIEKTARVPVTTLDAWAEKTVPENEKVQFLKFDIQGGELRALQGATRLLREDVRLIYSEVLFNPLYEQGAIFSDVDHYLRGFGFELYNFYGPKSNPRDLLLWANAIFVHPGKLGLENRAP